MNYNYLINQAKLLCNSNGVCEQRYPGVSAHVRAQAYARTRTR